MNTRKSTIHRRHFLKEAALVGGGCLLFSRVAQAEEKLPFRAFSDRSEWNKPIPPMPLLIPPAASLLNILRVQSQGPVAEAVHWQMG